MHFLDKMPWSITLFLVFNLCLTLTNGQPTTKHLDVEQCSRDTYRTTLEANVKLDEVKRMTSDLETKVTKMSRDIGEVKEWMSRLEYGRIEEVKKRIDVLLPVPEGAVRNWALGYDYLVVENRSSWEEARQGCFLQGFGLASIMSAEEDAFVRSIISPDQYSAPHGVIWIDGTDIYKEGCWIWSYPQVQNMSAVYTNWNPGEPSNSLHAKSREHCIELKDNGWNDATCSGRINYICKQPIGARVTSIATEEELRNYC